MVAAIFAITPGCQKPGCTAATRRRRDVTAASAALVETASRWSPRPDVRMKRAATRASSKPDSSAAIASALLVSKLQSVSSTELNTRPPRFVAQ